MKKKTFDDLLTQVLEDRNNLGTPKTVKSEEESAPSPALEKKMRSVFRRNKSRKGFRRMGKVAVICLISLFGTLLITLSLSSTIRAEVFRWVKEKWNNDTVYYFQGDSDKDYALPRYEAGWLPEGVTLVASDADTSGYTLYYSSADGSITILLGTDLVQSGSHLQLVQMEDFVMETIRLEERTIDEYHKGEKDRTAVWFEDNGKVCMSVDCNLTREEMLLFIRGLRRVED